MAASVRAPVGDEVALSMPISEESWAAGRRAVECVVGRLDLVAGEFRQLTGTLR